MDLPLAVLDEKQLNGYLDEMITESSKVTRDLNKDKEWDENMKFYRGKQWQDKLPSYRIPFTANYTKTTVKRLVALMTDTRPVVDVHTKLPGLEEMVQTTLTPAVRSNWDEQNYDQKIITGILPTAIILGSCVANSCFNPSLDDGHGDVDLGIIDPRSFILDPSIVRAADIDEADYAGYQTYASLATIKRLFPNRGGEVEPSGVVTRFLDKHNVGTGGFESPGHKILSRLSQTGSATSFAIKRAPIQEFFATDHRKVKELPTAIQDQAFQLGLTGDQEAFPGGRRIIRAGANKKILSDGPNPYIDRRKPYVMFDWGLEVENPWGDSEVNLIKSLQAILNKLGSAMTENAIKMNNNIWIGDRDALEKHEWNLLNDAPGLLVKLKQGRQLRRESPPALPSSVFQMLQWLVMVMDTLTGLVDATQGRRPVGIVSSNAVEALQIAAQVLIRLQTKKFENFLERLGQRMIARIFQFYTADRLMHLVGPGGKLVDYHFKRNELIGGKIQGADGKVRDFDLFKDVRDFAFRVSPGSSMAITRQQKAQMAMVLADRHMIPGSETLRVLEWDNAEELYAKAQEELRAQALSGQQEMAQNAKRARMAA